MRRALTIAATAAALALAGCGSGTSRVQAGEAGTAPTAPADTVLPGMRTCTDLATSSAPVLNSTDGSCSEGYSYRFAVGYSYTAEQCAHGPGGIIVINGDMWWLNGERQEGPPPDTTNAQPLYELVCGHP